MKSLKKIAAVVATLALTVGMTANCFAASWQSYFGVNEAWFEGAEGKLSSQSATYEDNRLGRMLGRSG